MSSDDVRRVREELERVTKEVASLRAGQDMLTKVLVARGDLAATHPQLLDKVRTAELRAARPRIYLGTLRDKYAIAGADIDCPSLLHLCKARCCTYSVELTEQDVEEGGVKFEIQRPYLLRHDADAYCSHLDRATGGCANYERRPATCREYDCRQDQRVWLDWEKRIPAPFSPV